MKILLCSNKVSIRERWLNALQSRYKNISECDSFSEVFATLGGDSQYSVLADEKCIGTIEVQELIRSFPESRIIIFSDNPNDINGIEYLKAGVVGYANTYISPELFQEVVKVVDAGGVWIGQDLMQRIVAASFQASGNKTINVNKLPGAELTARELEITGLIAQGYANKGIAYQLDITERTVKSHLNSIYRKTDTKGRLELALLYQR